MNHDISSNYSLLALTLASSDPQPMSQLSSFLEYAALSVLLEPSAALLHLSGTLKPTNVRECDSLATFKKNLKSTLFV